MKEANLKNNNVYEYNIKGVVVNEGERWYIKDNDKYHLASDLLTGIDLISINYDNYAVCEGDEIEVVIRIKRS